jgi:hypothetical protein
LKPGQGLMSCPQYFILLTPYIALTGSINKLNNFIAT